MVSTVRKQFDPGKCIVFFGKYAQQNLNEISSTPEGLKYLDWLSGEDWVHGYLRTQLTRFLLQPPIQRELDQILPDKEYESSDFEPSKSYLTGRQRTRSNASWIPTYFQDPDPESKRLRPGPQFAAIQDYNPIPTFFEIWEIALNLLERIEACQSYHDLEDIKPEIDFYKRFFSKQLTQKLQEAARKKISKVQLLDLYSDQLIRDAHLALEAITEQPELETILQEQAPELYDLVQLIRLSE
jgi:hypothetical protein